MTEKIMATADIMENEREEVVHKINLNGNLDC